MRKIRRTTLLSLWIFLPVFGFAQQIYELTPTEKLLFSRLDTLLSNNQKDSLVFLIDSLEQVAYEENSYDRYTFLVVRQIDVAPDETIDNFNYRTFLIQKLEKALIEGELTSDSLLDSYRLLGDYYNSGLEMDLALYNYRKGMKIYKNCPEDVETSLLSVLLSNFSDYYLSIQQYGEARLLIEKALELDQNAPEIDHYYLAVDYINLGISYQSADLNQTLKYFKLAHDQFEIEYDSLQVHYVDAYLTLFIQTAEIHMLLDQPTEALQLIDTFLRKQYILYNEDNILLGNAITQRGDIYQKTGKYQTALKNYKEAYTEYQRAQSPHRVRCIYDLLIKTADCYLAIDEPDKSLELIDWNFMLIDQSGTPEQCRIDKMPTSDLLFKLYMMQARALKSKYLSKPDKKALKEAQLAYRYALEVFEHIKISMGNRESRRIFLKNNYTFFEEAINLNYLLWEETGDESALEDLFFLTEKSKNNLLAEGINDTDNTITGGVPDSVLKTVWQLDNKITKIENIYFDKNNREDEALMSSLRSKLMELQEEKNIYLSKIENKYPQYYQVRYRVNVPSITEVQQRLSQQEGVLSYFLSSDHLYILLIDQQNFSVDRIPLDFSLTDLVSDFRESIINSSGIHNKATARDLLIYQKTAHDLYQKIFGPFVRKIPPRITIIPDNQLGNLAFDALLTHIPDTSTSLRDYPYLLNKYTINYQYSAHAILQKEKPIDSERKGFLAFAPKFENSASSDIMQLRDLGGLFYNDLEVDQIQSIMGGTIVKNQQATEANFVELAPDYQIIHLATHGKVSEENADYSYLAFQEIKDAQENELLYIKDIYNLKLKADLVVLSACETAAGTFDYGEGINSLSRGFIYSGAAAVLPTLWKISDATTVSIMEEFYQEINKSVPKDIALATAKKNFLNKTEAATAHPFFWAAFTMIGDPSPIVPIQTGADGIIIDWKILLLLIPLFVFYYKWWYKHRQKPVNH